MGREIPRLLIDLEPRPDFGHGWFDSESYAQIVWVCRSLYEKRPVGITTEVIDVWFRACLAGLDSVFSGLVQMHVNVKGMRASFLSEDTASLEDFKMWHYAVADAKRLKAHRNKVGTGDEDVPSPHDLVEYFRKELQEDILRQLREKERACERNLKNLSGQVERLKQKLAS